MLITFYTHATSSNVENFSKYLLKEYRLIARQNIWFFLFYFLYTKYCWEYETFSGISETQSAM